MGEAVERAVAPERLIGGPVTSAGGDRRPPKPERTTRPRRHRLLIAVGTATAGALIPIVSGAVYLLTNPIDARTA